MTLYMPFFRACTTLRSLTQLHAHLLVTGHHGDPLPSTKLIESYAQLGCLGSSRLVFETFPSPADSFMWGVLIKCHVWSRFFEDAVELYHRMVSGGGAEVSRFIYPSVLRACSCCRAHLGTGENVHGRVIKCGLDCDDVIRTCLLSLYGEMGSTSSAKKVFDEMSERDVVCWSSIISTYIDNGDALGGLGMFRLMVSGGVAPDSVTMISLAEACAQLGSLCLARSVHGQVLTWNIESNDDGSLNNSLITMYSKCGDLASAERLFYNSFYRNTASWTAMISSYNQGGRFHDAISVFLEMQRSGVGPNSVTLMALLFSCSGLGWVRGGKSVHCFIIRNSADPEYDFLGPPLIEFYADCGRLRDSEKVFGMIQGRDVVSWNMLISLYARKGLLDRALSTLGQMLTNGVMPDSFSLATSLSACGNLGLLQVGREIHGHVVRTGFSNEYVQNALIDMYSKCSRVDWAHNLFINAQQRSVVTWNSMICGFSQNGYSQEAIKLFTQMYTRRLYMDEVTFLAAIQACTDLVYIEKGRWLHHKLITCGISNSIYVDTALLNMYSKCGDQRTAQMIFDRMTEKSVVSWSAMIAGYGIHGQVTSALSVFNQMIESGIKPNEITFMNILSTCSHAGYLEEGKFCFKLMKEYGVEPQMEHFACLVDLLSRSGNLDDAYSVIRSMSLPADAGIWSSFLSGCRVHRRFDLILTVKRNLVNVETRDTGYFSLLSNIYAEEGNWGESGKLRSVMESTGLKKVRGYSMIELG
ncbi:putative pentatricopeptide repeat-containing protein At1g69350, mitochondrial isoform X1 [Punica granatum]|uniref:Pentatricopeptide repeat-containing protein At1g69350, mitochondrial isoform X1 n=2 Tax=Punica granatum TaxID=22663 RepID=A0A6P8D3Y4_PUNGR|nr:putative pentatricopeptide repeat-containing protein At1g69350, mitochondrial isoform X1 [Punica granatum]XP_031386196.1 putative pentatricopeptide repeat-containing protein At1g69350, mitochondrial isoform X1 [Punica granatum]XP_031386197.1 putative pentatricopeptide repeat-containing protein At1g69350, mitochondrial isoform X1 [Punica granatum]XP_031386198.1 putative pentatricopeptide repeat-containing protein At1g69350, mitochondrial isoform X1 [Punica granatum]XP_031386200.1 putative pen